MERVADGGWGEKEGGRESRRVPHLCMGVV